MNDFSVRPRIYIWVVTALFLLACGLPLLAEPTPVQLPPTQSLEILETSIAQTVSAAQTQTAISLPTHTLTPTRTRVPTITATATPTFFFFIHTSTSLPSEVPSQAAVTPNPSQIAGDGDEEVTPVRPKKEWACIVTSTVPGKGTVIRRGQTFIVSWTVLNTGTKTWPNTGVDFQYLTGFRMDGRRIQDLSRTIAPGHEITLKIQLTAPKKVDTYNTIWTLRVGNRSFCQMKIIFDVQ